MKAAGRLAPQRIVYSVGCLAAAVFLTGCRGDADGVRGLTDFDRDRVPSLHAQAALARRRNAAPVLPPGPLTLLDLLATAEARNPQLAAARSGVGVAGGQVWQAALYPNPSVSVVAEEVPFEGFEGSKTTAEIGQPIILGPRRRNAIRTAEAQQAVRRAEAEAVRRALFGEVALLHTRLLALRREQQVTRELRDLAQQAVDTARTRYEGGAATEPEVILPEVEAYQLQSASDRLARDLAATEQQLGLLLDTTPIAADRLADELDQDPQGLALEALESVMRRTHPALAVADREIKAAAARLEQIRAERIPDLEVQAGLGYSGDGEAGIFNLGIGMEIPLWDRRQGDILSTRYEIIRLQKQRRARENELLGELAAAHGDYEAARAQLRVLREQIAPRAERAFEQTTEAYRAGNVSFPALLDAQRTLMGTRRALIGLARDAAAARARMAAIAGTDFLAAAPDAGPTHVGGATTQPTTVPADRAEEIE